MSEMLRKLLACVLRCLVPYYALVITNNIWAWRLNQEQNNLFKTKSIKILGIKNSPKQGISWIPVSLNPESSK